MADHQNGGGRLKYYLPWIGMAAVLGLMWAFIAE
jgi:hypothetical protein